MRNELLEHNERYYVSDDPIIADADYDALVAELRAHRGSSTRRSPRTDSPTQQVSGRRSELFAPVVHSTPLLSLDNAFDEADLSWHERITKRLAQAGVASRA